MTPTPCKGRIWPRDARHIQNAQAFYAKIPQYAAGRSVECTAQVVGKQGRGKLAMGAWFAWSRIHQGAKVDCGVVTHDEPIRGDILHLQAPQLGTGVISFFLITSIER